jgi:hypothetical protein
VVEWLNMTLARAETVQAHLMNPFRLMDREGGVSVRSFRAA